MKVLVTLDQTRYSEGAIRFLRHVTLPVGSELFLLHVIPLPQKITGLAKERILKISQQIQEVQKDEREQACRFLSKVEKTLSRQDVQVYTLVKKGFPGEEILKTIQTKDVDLVLLGTRGYSKAAGMLLGSVSQWVLYEAPCSVLIARTRPRKKNNGQGMNILLAADGSPDARAAVDFVKTVKFPRASHITILHVVKKHVYETGQALTGDSKDENKLAKLAEELLEIRGREGAKLLEQTRKAVASLDLTITERLVYGNPADEILKTSRYIRADLIVMGSRGTTGVKRMFMGSVSNKVAHSAGCPVAIIRNKSKR